MGVPPRWVRSTPVIFTGSPRAAGFGGSSFSLPPPSLFPVTPAGADCLRPGRFLLDSQLSEVGVWVLCPRSSTLDVPWLTVVSCFFFHHPRRTDILLVRTNCFSHCFDGLVSFLSRFSLACIVCGFQRKRCSYVCWHRCRLSLSRANCL